MSVRDHEFAHANDVPLPEPDKAFRWRCDGVAHRAGCAVDAALAEDIRCFRWDYQLELWLRAGSLELCPECKPGEFP